ncbi:hypothetical protein IC229_02790 [Spirosoma sp. BT702]|uniref:Lipoprotein n=1 Tax=Spirosoma profusum TaxID=2771354 RepID=A0A926XT77_9BACT|nr:hypothetical protein [Spirosoma profusum]MBD2699547.1 hypothetical protein [Spirosoma profusum]
MQTTLKRLSGLLIVLLSSCHTELTPSEPTPLFQNVSIAEGGQVNVLDGLTLRIDEITDSRCPAGKQCIWAGNANVAFTANVRDDFQALSLCLGACRQGLASRDSVDMYLKKAHYRIVLTDLKIYSDVTPNLPREAVLEAKRL